MGNWFSGKDTYTDVENNYGYREFKVMSNIGNFNNGLHGNYIENNYLPNVEYTGIGDLRNYGEVNMWDRSTTNNYRPGDMIINKVQSNIGNFNNRGYYTENNYP